MFDTECLHTPYLPPPTQSSSHRSPALKAQQQGHHQSVPEGDLLNLDQQGGNTTNSTSNSNSNSNSKPSIPRRKTGFSKTPGGRSRNLSTDRTNNGEETDDDEHEEEWVPDVFLFEYGTVVIWGMTEKEEKRFLSSLYVTFLFSSNNKSSHGSYY